MPQGYRDFHHLAWRDRVVGRALEIISAMVHRCADAPYGFHCLVCRDRVMGRVLEIISAMVHRCADAPYGFHCLV